MGCGFAFQTAQWLVDCTAPDLLAGRPLAAALKRYACTVARRLGGHRFLINDFARRRRFNAIERLMFSAAAKDANMSRHLHAFGARLIGPMGLLAPGALLRAAWVNLRSSDAIRSPLIEQTGPREAPTVPFTVLADGGRLIYKGLVYGGWPVVLL